MMVVKKIISNGAMVSLKKRPNYEGNLNISKEKIDEKSIRFKKNEN